jgi:deazaflavin-dependent oxidoreductase (nitroreductase family)
MSDQQSNVVPQCIQTPGPTLEQPPSRRSSLRWWERLLEQVASTCLGGWFYVHVATWLDPVLFHWSGGRVRCAVTWPLLLTTIGARSGQPRTVPLLFLTENNLPTARLVLAASNGGRRRHPAWYYHLKTHPQVQVAARAWARTDLAHEAEEEERTQLWPRMVDLYPSYAAYQRRLSDWQMPLIILTPVGQEGTGAACQEEQHR